MRSRTRRLRSAARSRAPGIAFDPLTFVALRIVEGSADEHVDPLACLNRLVEFGFLERSVALALDLLEDAA